MRVTLGADACGAFQAQLVTTCGNTISEPWVRITDAGIWKQCGRAEDWMCNTFATCNEITLEGFMLQRWCGGHGYVFGFDHTFTCPSGRTVTMHTDFSV